MNLNGTIQSFKVIGTMRDWATPSPTGHASGTSKTEDA
jgi:hypothetical protein